MGKNKVDPDANLSICVPARPEPDLDGLLKRLEADYRLIPWNTEEPLEGDRSGAVLLDMRTGDLPDINPLKETPRPLILVGDDRRGDLLSRLGGHPLVTISLEWSLDFIVELIHVSLRSLTNASDLFESKLGRLQEELAVVAEERGLELLLKENELNRYKDFKTRLLKRLGDSERGYIAEILRNAKKVVEGCEDSEGSPMIEPVKAIRRSVRDIEQFLSHDFWKRAEDALRGRNILVISSVRKSRRLLVRSLFGIGVSVQAASNVEEGMELLRTTPFDIMYVDWENAAIIKPALEMNPEMHTVLMTSELIFENVGREMMDLPLSNLLIASDVGAGGSRDAILSRELTVTAGKLLSGDIFGLEKYLAWGTAIREARVTGSEQRFELLDRVGEYASHCGLRQSFCQNLETLTDELLMNAIWDAPADERGKAKYVHLSRQEPLELEPDEYAVVRWGSDSNLLGISVADRYGRLDREHAFRYLSKCFARREDQIDTKVGGAGLGLYYAFLSVSTFVINVAPGSRTEVIGLLDMNISPRELMVRPRSYLYFRSPVPAPPL